MIDTQNPNERKKLILAGGLGLVAIVLLWWAFFGFGGSDKTPTRTTGGPPTASNNPPTPVRNQASQPVELQPDLLEQLRPIAYQYSLPDVPEARRNIFVYYEPPKPVPTVSSVPVESPTPPPPVLLARLSPANVFARTGDFTLEVTGDKFTPQLKVLVDNSVLPTRYLGPQQITATVPAAMIADPGSRQVMLRSPDGALYSNTSMISVAAPPTPNYNYVGIIGTTRYIDTAILQDKNSKEVVNVQRGDLLGGRFRITSISEKELVLMDSNLRIRHTLPFTSQPDRGNPQSRPTPRPEGEDDEP